MGFHNLDDLKKEVLEIRDRNPQLSLDNAFVAWFLRAFITDSEESAVASLKGGARDKGIDAVYVDHDSRVVFILQGKYHQKANPPTEKRSDVIALGDLGRVLLSDEAKAFNALLQNAETTVRDELERARTLIQKRGYGLNLQFVTTGKVSKTHREEAIQRIDNWENASYHVFSGNDLSRLMQDYIEGAAPPVPTIMLPVYGEQLFNCFDDHTKISSWVFSMVGSDLGNLYNSVGLRLFARNIRGFLGNTDINRGMESTIKKEPEYFWYFNNGVTIVCDEAKQITERGHKHLRVLNAQIINGQQTTRILSKHKSSRATILVKVIAVPRDSDSAHIHYNHLISSIVSATNWQNAISQSDLKSNDVEQVRLERELKKLGYQYLRKKQTIAEARRSFGNRYSYMIKKEDLAKYAGACLVDPYEVRLGINRLFEDDIYSIIFNGRSSSEYLTFYWLHRIAAWFSQGDIRRGYAKWLVLNFMWAQIGSSLRRPALRDNFRYIAERSNSYDKELKPFYKTIDATFRSAMAFYRQNKRTPEGIMDESSFFKHKNIHERFEKFVNSSKNRKERSLITMQLKTFLKYLETFER
jgi:hypothetical protein